MYVDVSIYYLSIYLSTYILERKGESEERKVEGRRESEREEGRYHIIVLFHFLTTCNKQDWFRPKQEHQI